jgi:hypothetical protein
MKYDGVVTGTSLLAVLLVTLHVAGDIARGLEAGKLVDLLILVLVAVVWLYATLVLPGRRAGYVILLVGALIGLVIPVVHMKGAGIGGGDGRAEGEFFFVWIMLALGVASAFLLLLAVRGLWRLRSAERVGVGQ